MSCAPAGAAASTRASSSAEPVNRVIAILLRSLRGGGGHLDAGNLRPDLRLVAPIEHVRDRGLRERARRRLHRIEAVTHRANGGETPVIVRRAIEIDQVNERGKRAPVLPRHRGECILVVQTVTNPRLNAATVRRGPPPPYVHAPRAAAAAPAGASSSSHRATRRPAPSAPRHRPGPVARRGS